MFTYADGFKHLQAHVATTAFDSYDIVDAPKCHPNTRKAVLDDIMNWITIQTAMRVQWILWLNGAAGAGKSAIGRSIVALCLEQTVPIAQFFFFRTDSTRNNLKPVVATLVHQLMETIPELRLIIIFLNDSFETIKSTHPFGDELRRRNWPAQADIDDIMHRASRKFIYASVVIRFISAVHQHPAQLLEIVRGLRPTGNLMPFAQLGALYRYIFSQVVDIQATSLVLAWEMFTLDKQQIISGGTSLFKWKVDNVCGTMSNIDTKASAMLGATMGAL